jgi:hypothetical protein
MSVYLMSSLHLTHNHLLFRRDSVHPRDVVSPRDAEHSDRGRQLLVRPAVRLQVRWMVVLLSNDLD